MPIVSITVERPQMPSSITLWSGPSFFARTPVQRTFSGYLAPGYPLDKCRRSCQSFRNWLCTYGCGGSLQIRRKNCRKTSFPLIQNIQNSPVMNLLPVGLLCRGKSPAGTANHFRHGLKSWNHAFHRENGAWTSDKGNADCVGES